MGSGSAGQARWELCGQAAASTGLPRAHRGEMPARGGGAVVKGLLKGCRVEVLLPKLSWCHVLGWM